MDVEVCYASPPGVERVVVRVVVRVGASCTVGEAVMASGILERLRLNRSALVFAVFGRRTGLEAALAPGDRVELLRSLVVDPMTARRRRAARRSDKDVR